VTLQSLFEWFESWPFSEAVRQSSWLFPSLECVHVIAITLVVGSVMLVDLRVLGITSPKKPVNEMALEVLPWTWGLFFVALASGFFMFAAKAHAYFDNVPFRLKMLLMAAAGANMLFFHFVPYRTVSAWSHGAPAPALAKICCGLSLVCWILVVAMGRWIGFTIEG
jgi:hypothetical protein